jgi:hypothetical protein
MFFMVKKNSESLRHWQVLEVHWDDDPDGISDREIG